MTTSPMWRAAAALFGWDHPVPCVALCPAGVDIPGYIALVRAGRYNDAVRLIRKDNPSRPYAAMSASTRARHTARRSMVDDAVNICGIKRFACDHADNTTPPVPHLRPAKRIGIIGGGPGGLSAAYFLSLMGHQVVVYDQRPKLGGMLRYGIPDYRLPQDKLDADIDFILSTGIEGCTPAFPSAAIFRSPRLRTSTTRFTSPSVRITTRRSAFRRGRSRVPPRCSCSATLARSRAGLQGASASASSAAATCRWMQPEPQSVSVASAVTCVYRRRVTDMTALGRRSRKHRAKAARFSLQAPDHIETDGNGPRYRSVDTSAGHRVPPARTVVRVPTMPISRCSARRATLSSSLSAGSPSMQSRSSRLHRSCAAKDPG